MLQPCQVSIFGSLTMYVLTFRWYSITHFEVVEAVPLEVVVLCNRMLSWDKFLISSKFMAEFGAIGSAKI